MSCVLFVDIERCVGCKRCEIACAVEHSETKSIYTAPFERVKPVPRVECTPPPATWCPLSACTVRLMSEEAWYTIAARNLSLAEDMGLDVLTLCNGCNKTLLKANRDLKADEELRERVNSHLRTVGREFKGSISVLSVLRLLYEDIGINGVRRRFKNPLRGVRAAVHLGCHIYDELREYDDVRNPRALKELMDALGAEVVSYPTESLCCAYFAWNMDRELSMEVSKRKLTDIADSGADLIVVICPTCLHQLEHVQFMLRGLRIPVLYYTQLMGLAMGFKPEEMGIQYHRIKPEPPLV